MRLRRAGVIAAAPTRGRVLVPRAGVESGALGAVTGTMGPAPVVEAAAWGLARAARAVAAFWRRAAEVAGETRDIVSIEILVGGVRILSVCVCECRCGFVWMTRSNRR